MLSFTNTVVQQFSKTLVLVLYKQFDPTKFTHIRSGILIGSRVVFVCFVKVWVRDIEEKLLGA